MLHSVVVLYHPGKPRAVDEAAWLGVELERRGVSAKLSSVWGREAVCHETLGSDLVVALGGDGTIIGVARSVAHAGTPVLGVNLGRVGFLAELTPERLHERIDDLAAGNFWIERRSMLEVEWRDDERSEHFPCLNEVAVTRGLATRSVHVAIGLDGEHFLTYTADAVLVATATGSTAYSLAAGGPILYPEAREFMLTPVAPHLHIGRSIIVPEGTRVTLHLTGDRPGVMSVDGMDERALECDQDVHVRRSETEACFARFGPQTYFYTAIAQRLQ